MYLTDEDVRDIVTLLDSSFVCELNLKTEHFSLTLRREEGQWTRETRTSGAPRLVEGAAATPLAGAPFGEKAQAAATAEPKGTTAVRAPFASTFYRAPKPGAAPFVTLGQAVETDTVVGIVEAMKLMTSVYAGAPGVVTEICVGDGVFVDKDQVVMRLGKEPRKKSAKKSARTSA